MRGISALALASIVAVGGIIAYYNPSLFTLDAGQSLIARSFLDSCVRPPGSIVVIAGIAGFNDSKTHGAPSSPWPIISVARGQTVDLIICNSDPVQVHGFVIDHYFPGGIVLNPGAAYMIKFLAGDPGSFRIYCYVFCTVHKFMLGQLTVSA